MKVALVTTPWSSRSGIADYSRHLLPYLREGADVDVFVEVGRQGEESGDEPLKSVADLKPRDYDQILYQLGNEGQHAFMLPMLKGLGGTVMLHDWVLFDLAMAAHGSLRRGGLRGLQRAFREGGGREAHQYWAQGRNGSQRVDGLHFCLGWHAPEEQGRWSAQVAEIALPGAERAELDLLLPEGRRLVLSQAGRVIGKWKGPSDGWLELELDSQAQAPLRFDVSGGRRNAGDDHRELGVFLRAGKYRCADRERVLDLREAATPAAEGLSAARFDLPFNRSVVRHADAFLVHSDWVGDQVLASRNAPTPISRVAHGVERRWDEVDAADAREQLKLCESWRDDFWLVSFGTLQPHKRPRILLDALAELKDAGVRLLCVGDERADEFDLRAEVERRALKDHVHLTGWLPEDEAWRALAAGDLAINLRGPSTGGTSGGASQALSLGKPVVVSDVPEFAHLPSGAVLRLPAGPQESQRLAAMIRGLVGDSARMGQLASGARQAVDEELHWSHVARRYLEVLENFPRARASRRSLLVRFLHATQREEQVTAPKEA